MVKTFRVIGMALLMMSVGIGFTSCGDDDDEIDGVKKENTLNSGYKDVTSVDKYCGTFYRTTQVLIEANGGEKIGTKLMIETRVRIEKISNSEVKINKDVLDGNSWKLSDSYEYKLKEFKDDCAIRITSSSQTLYFKENIFRIAERKSDYTEAFDYERMSDEEAAAIIEKQQKKDETTKPTEDEKVDEQPQDPKVDEPTQDPTKDDNQGDDNQETYVDSKQYDGVYWLTSLVKYKNGQKSSESNVDDPISSIMVEGMSDGLVEIQLYTCKDVTDLSTFGPSGSPVTMKIDEEGKVYDSEGYPQYVFSDGVVIWVGYTDKNTATFTMYVYERQ